MNTTVYFGYFQNNIAATRFSSTRTQEKDAEAFSASITSFIENVLASGKPPSPANIATLKAQFKSINPDKAKQLIPTLLAPPVIRTYKKGSNTIYVAQDNELPMGHTKSRGALYVFAKNRKNYDDFVTPFGGYVSPALADAAKLLNVKLKFVIDESRLKEPVVQDTKARGGTNVEFIPVKVPKGHPNSFDYVFEQAEKEARKNPKSFHIPVSTDGLTIVEDVIGLYAKWAMAEQRLTPDIVACACGAGVLTRGLQKGIPASQSQHIVTNFVPTKYSVGKHGIGQAQLLENTDGFHDVAKTDAPFPITGNVDAKAWNGLMNYLEANQLKNKNVLFWNVAPPSPHH